jgi:hypothetical protein
MTNTNPRDLIKRLADALEAWLEDEFIRASHSDKLLVSRARAYLAQSELTLTVQGCNDMPKHRFNFLYEAFTGEIVLDGSFTREDLIEIANTVPPTEA